MGDWDDDDDWENQSDSELDAKLGLNKAKEQQAPAFDDEEDLAVKERAAADASQHADLKKKGQALAAKKKAQEEQLMEEEVARKAMEVEAELEASMTKDELRAYKQRQIEEADNKLTDDLFGSIDDRPVAAAGAGRGGAAAGDAVVMVDIKDHLKHAHMVADCMKDHGKTSLAKTFIKEVITKSQDVLDDDAITEIIKTCNVIKNEKVQAAKRKTKGQAQKSKKVDKKAVAAARKIQVETFGDNDQYDAYDEMAHDYEDSFF